MKALYQALSLVFGLVWAGPASAAILERVDPLPITYVQGVGGDFAVFDFSATGDVTNLLNGVDVSSNTSGCEGGDFATFPSGTIALMQRGTCEFDVKVENAFLAGAVGALIFNNVPGFFTGTGNVTTILAMALTRERGLELLSLLSGPVTMHMQVTSADLPVPEPSTLGLIGLGLLGLGAMRRRRPPV